MPFRVCKSGSAPHLLTSLTLSRSSILPLPGAAPPDQDVRRRQVIDELTISPESFMGWVKRLKERWLRSFAGGVFMAAATPAKLTDKVLATLVKLHYDESQPELLLLLNDESLRFYSILRPDGQVASSGVGLERGVFNAALEKALANTGYWRPSGGVIYPMFSLLRDSTTTRKMQWKAFGTLCALYLLYYNVGPTPLSPFLLLAAIGGKEAFMSLSERELLALDADAARKLAPWFALGPNQPLPMSPRSPLGQLLIECLDIQVWTMTTSPSVT